MVNGQSIVSMDSERASASACVRVQTSVHVTMDGERAIDSVYGCIYVSMDSEHASASASASACVRVQTSVRVRIQSLDETRVRMQTKNAYER